MAGLGDDYIFIQTDPLFSLVLLVTNELQDQERLQVVNSQSTHTRPIRGNKDDYDGPGGTLYSKWSGEYNFSKTASAVFRLAMLTATKCVPVKEWPNGPTKKTPARTLNEGTLSANFTCELGQPFSLANDDATMSNYYSKYDQMYPPFFILDKLKRAPVRENVRHADLNGMMFIFRNNFSELIKITATAFARQLLDRDDCFDASVQVTVIRRQVTAGVDGYWMTLLKFITSGKQPSEWPYAPKHVPRPLPPPLLEGIANLKL